MEEIVNVKVCDDCPLCIWINSVGSELCFHPKTKYKTIDDSKNTIPDFCPLINSKITIQLSGMDK